MKKSSLITLVVCLFSVLGVSTATAQTGTSIRVKMPYAVTVGTVTLPAGDFTITDLKDNGHESFFLVRSAAGPSVDMMMQRSESPENSQLTKSAVQLRHVGGNYEIEGIRVDGQDYKIN